MLTAAICRTLDQAGLGVYDRAGANLFVEDLPPTPVDAVSVATKPGMPYDLSGDSVVGVAVTVRQKTGTGTQRPGHDRAWAIRSALKQLRGVTLAAGTVDEQRVAWVLPDDTGPSPLGVSGGVPLWGLRFYICTPDT